MDSNISIEHLYQKEITGSERLRSLVLIGLLAAEAIVLLVIYFFYQDHYLQLFTTHLALYAILIFTMIIILYEVGIHYLVSKKNHWLILNGKVFGYFSSFSEVTLLTILLIFIVEFSEQTTILQAPATLTYFIFIVLSTLRLKFSLSIFTGIVAAAEYIFVNIYYSTMYYQFKFDQELSKPIGMQYLGQGLIMIIAGIAAGFVAELIRNKMVVSWENMRQKNEVIDLFGQQISTKIAENVIASKNELAGIKKQVCIMFLDIRDFTPFVEKSKPEEVVSFLNNLFEFMIEIVQKYDGVINQFLGDGFMATFGAPVSLQNSSQQATKASIEIINKVNDEVIKGNIPNTRIGIGLHFDEAITGNIGSELRKQYSITGKVVIMASRIEQLNKLFNSQLLISAEVYNQIDDGMQQQFINLGYSSVKGSEQAVLLYKFVEEVEN